VAMVGGSGPGLAGCARPALVYMSLSGRSLTFSRRLRGMRPVRGGWRIFAEGVICGLGGCRMVSFPAVHGLGKAWPKPFQAGSSLGIGCAWHSSSLARNTMRWAARS
jgi:hypothetical protein